jgi:osmotically-inducible protein OsmY
MGVPGVDGDRDDQHAPLKACDGPAAMPKTFLTRVLMVLVAAAAAGVQPVLARNPADAAADADADALTEALARRRLTQDDLAPFHRLDVSVHEGVATLTGTVRTKNTLDAVLREVGKVSGVEQVRDRVKVEPNP